MCQWVSSWWYSRDLGAVFIQRPVSLWSRKRGCFSSSLKARKSPHPSLKVIRQEEFSWTLWRVSLSFYSGPSTDWTRPTTLWRAICFFQSIYLNVNHIQKHPHRNTQDTIRPNIWAPCDPARLTLEINHHRCHVQSYLNPMPTDIFTRELLLGLEKCCCDGQQLELWEPGTLMPIMTRIKAHLHLTERSILASSCPEEPHITPPPPPRHYSSKHGQVRAVLRRLECAQQSFGALVNMQISYILGPFFWI